MRTDTNFYYLGVMSKQTKTQAAGAQGVPPLVPTVEQLEKNVDQDLAKCVAFLNWIRSTPLAKQWLAEFAHGQISNSVNAKAQEAPANERS